MSLTSTLFFVIFLEDLKNMIAYPVTFTILIKNRRKTAVFVKNILLKINPPRKWNAG